MKPGALKERLERCAAQRLEPTAFSIGHRGAPARFPEHTEESYRAAAQMGAGLIECDVTLTKDRQLVCRHSPCDLAATTDILNHLELARTCSYPFARSMPLPGTGPRPTCCTNALTLAEFQTLCGKMDDAPDPSAESSDDERYRKTSKTPEPGCAKVLSHRESIALIDRLGRNFIPELKAPLAPLPHEGGFTQQKYAQQMIDDYKAAGIGPKRVFPQSSNLEDIRYWLAHEPRFGRQAIFLDERVDADGGYDAAVADLPNLARDGLRIVAPPMWALVTLDAAGHIVPSTYAKTARGSGLDLVTWTLERSGALTKGGGYFYKSVSSAVSGDGDTYVMLDVLAQQVGIRGIFSDWPATVTYYANCVGL